MSEKSIALLLYLRQNKDINCLTIDSLIKYGFDSNDALIALDFDLDFNQMKDNSSQQKSLLTNTLIEIKDKFKNKCNFLKSFGYKRFKCNYNKSAAT